MMGGRGAGRSTVASQYADSKLTAKEYFRCAIMRYILSDIRNSIYREIVHYLFKKIIQKQLAIPGLANIPATLPSLFRILLKRKEWYLPHADS